MLVVDDLQEKNKDLTIQKEHSSTILEQKKELIERLESSKKELDGQLEKSKHTIQTLS